MMAETKKQQILEIAEEMEIERYTPAEVEQIRRQMLARHGEAGKTATDHIAGVLKEAGKRVVWTTRADEESQYEEEFQDLLHFSTLEEAEMCLTRLDELLRKFVGTGDKAEAERVLEIARLGRRRAEMISRNQKVEEKKRKEKEEIAQWFRIWLDTPDVFFDWLEARKQAPDFRKRFGEAEA